VRKSAGELSLCVLGAVDGTRYIGSPRMCWINSILEWSGKTYMELKALAQNRITWNKLLRNFSASAIELL